jgi:HlyD family secretion protein
MIRDTSSQDAVIAAPKGQTAKRRLVIAAAAVALLAAGYYLFHTWQGSDHSINISRLRIAEVTRGTLIRDAAVNGRIVAAISPTLYSTSRIWVPRVTSAMRRREMLIEWSLPCQVWNR